MKRKGSLNVINYNIASKKRKQINLFEQALESVLSYTILDYFIEKYDYSNKCYPVLNLLLCNRSIYKLLIKCFVKRGLFDLTKIKDYPSEKRKLVSNIFINEDKLWNFRNENISSSLKTLILQKFNQPLTENIFPDSLVVIDFGPYFNQTVGCNILPKKLLKLKFGHEYNQSLIKNALPDSLTQLTLGY